MAEEQLQIRAKPFAFWAITIFVCCFVFLLRHAPSLREDALLAWTICAAMSLVVAVAGAFTVCGLATACRGFKSGQLGLADLIAPAVVLLGLVLLFVGQVYLPKVVGAVELCFWIVVPAMCLLGWRRGRKRTAASVHCQPPPKKESELR